MYCIGGIFLSELFQISFIVQLKCNNKYIFILTSNKTTILIQYDNLNE